MPINFADISTNTLGLFLFPFGGDFILDSSLGIFYRSLEEKNRCSLFNKLSLAYRLQLVLNVLFSRVTHG